MAVEVMERNKIAELAETEEIKEARKLYRESNEMLYVDGDILSFASMLSGICGQNVYVGQDAAVYFEILDTRDFLLEKYFGLSNNEIEKYKDKIEKYLQEAKKELEFLKSEILKK